MMYNRNRFNDFKIDSNGFQKLYDLLTKKNKDENEKNLCITEYQNLWLNVKNIFFKQKFTQKRFENSELSKMKSELFKNKYLENENLSFDIKENTSLELLFKIIRHKEHTSYINNYENEFDNYYEKNEEPPAINALIKEIQSLQKLLYINDDMKKSEIASSKKKIELYLFLIYMILKNYPFYVPKRSYLEKYFLQLKQYKDWPVPIGNHGFNLYKLFINDLYLPGITILQEIREKYFLDFIDPNKFLLVSDDFLRYYFFYDNNNSSFYKTLIEDATDQNFNINAKELFSPGTKHSLFNIQEFKSKADAKSVKEFNYLTIIHLIIFCCQQILSHNEKIRLSIFQRLCEQYFKSIPDYKNKDGFILDLVTKTKIEPKEDNILNTYEKNISRNTSNKSLLNSFFNILDEGLKTDYYKDFLPLIKVVSKKIIESINGQEGQYNIQLINLREFLMPKIETKNINDTSLITIYQNNYINIEDKYLAHLSKEINYEEYNVYPEELKRIQQFNNVVRMKKKILEQNLKMRYIFQESQLIKFVNILVKDVEELYEKIKEKNYKEEKILMEQKIKEKEKKEKRLHEDSYEKYNINSNKFNNIQAEKEKKKKEKEKELNNLTYVELKKHLEKSPNNADLKKKIENRETKALPEVENFLKSIIIYIIPNSSKEEKDLSLSDYMQRNDFIYKFLMSEENGNLDNNIMQVKENLCIYLTEAKYFFELDIYKIILKSDPVLYREEEKIFVDYFYSYIEVEIEPGGGIQISYLNNKETPEHEIILADVVEIKKIYILNLALKDKEIKENLSGAKYILNENCGLLNVYCIKNNVSNEYDNYNYYGKVIALQSISESFKCDEIKINGNFRIKGIKNTQNINFKELIIGHATYDFEDYEKNIKLRIATFSEFE